MRESLGGIVLQVSLFNVVTVASQQSKDLMGGYTSMIRFYSPRRTSLKNS